MSLTSTAVWAAQPAYGPGQRRTRAARRGLKHPGGETISATPHLRKVAVDLRGWLRRWIGVDVRHLRKDSRSPQRVAELRRWTPVDRFYLRRVFVLVRPRV